MRIKLISKRRRQVRDQLRKATAIPPVSRIERAVWPYLPRG